MDSTVSEKHKRRRSFHLFERPKYLLAKAFGGSRSRSFSRQPSHKEAFPIDACPTQLSPKGSCSGAVSIKETETDTKHVAQSSDNFVSPITAPSDDHILNSPHRTLWEDAIVKIQNSNEDPKLVAVVKELGTQATLSPDDTVRTIAAMIEGEMKRGVEDQHAFKGVASTFVEQTVSVINKFLAVGDVVASFDPVHAALPWAAVRFVLVVCSFAPSVS